MNATAARVRPHRAVLLGKAGFPESSYLTAGGMDSGFGPYYLPVDSKHPLNMNDDPSNSRDSPPAAASYSEIELLARQTGMSVDTVQEIYQVELDKIESSARIKTFVPVLAHRRVKALLLSKADIAHPTCDFSSDSGAIPPEVLTASAHRSAGSNLA